MASENRISVIQDDIRRRVRGPVLPRGNYSVLVDHRRRVIRLYSPASSFIIEPKLTIKKKEEATVKVPVVVETPVEVVVVEEEVEVVVDVPGSV